MKPDFEDIALIPARSGSLQVGRSLAGHPLIAYTIAAAKQSGIFRQIFVSSDSSDMLDLARAAGCSTHRRKPHHATRESPDLEWVHDLLTCPWMQHAFAKYLGSPEYFAILRPTSPFRTAATIQRAWAELARSECDYLRAVRPARAHPPPEQTLPAVYQQSTSVEIVKCAMVRDRLYPSLCGGRVYRFLSPEPDGFEIRTEDDVAYVEKKIASGEWTLPEVG